MSIRIIDENDMLSQQKVMFTGVKHTDGRL